ncbi:MAG: SCO family protein [Longimicrobiales bacterium]
MRRAAFTAALALPLLALAALRWIDDRRNALPPLFIAPAFELTDQTGAVFSSDSLRGQVWIAAFTYTSCPDVCSLISARLASLRDSLAAAGRLGEQVRLVSISVDPERDTPPILAAYARSFGAADPAAWAFLTGDPDTVRRVVIEGFYLPIVGPEPIPNATTVAGHRAEGAPADSVRRRGAPAEHTEPHGSGAAATDYLISHSDRLLLVDGEGRVRGIYPALDPNTPARLFSDLDRLL